MLEFLMENLELIVGLGLGGLFALAYMVVKKTKTTLDDDAVRFAEAHKETIRTKLIVWLKKFITKK